MPPSPPTPRPPPFAAPRYPLRLLNPSSSHPPPPPLPPPSIPLVHPFTPASNKLHPHSFPIVHPSALASSELHPHRHPSTLASRNLHPHSCPPSTPSTTTSSDLHLQCCPLLPLSVFASSELHPHRHPHRMSSRLLRYRSAPSTHIGDVCEEFLPHRSSPEEAESMFQRFMGNSHLGDKQGVGFGQRSTAQFMPSSTEEEVAARGAITSAAAPQMLFQPQQQHPFPNLSAAAPAPTTAPNLIRHSSSRARLFSQLNVENVLSGEYYRGRLKEQMSFPSRQGSAGFMALISKNCEENADYGGPVQNGIARSYIPGYPLDSTSPPVSSTPIVAPSSIPLSCLQRAPPLSSPPSIPLHPRLQQPPAP